MLSANAENFSFQIPLLLLEFPLLSSFDLFKTVSSCLVIMIMQYLAKMKSPVTFSRT